LVMLSRATTRANRELRVRGEELRLALREPDRQRRIECLATGLTGRQLDEVTMIGDLRCHVLLDVCRAIFHDPPSVFGLRDAW
jgi:hypothetical protein